MKAWGYWRESRIDSHRFQGLIQTGLQRTVPPEWLVIRNLSSYDCNSPFVVHRLNNGIYAALVNSPGFRNILVPKKPGAPASRIIS